jgi:hypothetical protein
MTSYEQREKEGEKKHMTTPCKDFCLTLFLEIRPRSNFNLIKPQHGKVQVGLLIGGLFVLAIFVLIF